MKNIILVLFVIFSAQLFEAAAQQHRFRGDRPNKRIEELQKLKLIEILDMDEDTTLKFFTRRNKHRDTMMELNDNGDKLLDRMEEMLKNENNQELSRLIDEYLKNEARIIDERNNFINSLSDILSEEQVASFLVFEQRFREEIRDIILRERRQRRN